MKLTFPTLDIVIERAIDKAHRVHIKVASYMRALRQINNEPEAV